MFMSFYLAVCHCYLHERFLIVPFPCVLSVALVQFCKYKPAAPFRQDAKKTLLLLATSLYRATAPEPRNRFKSKSWCVPLSI